MRADIRLRMDWATTRDKLGDSPLDVELQAERASALGRAGRRLERALAALPDPATQAELTLAANAAWEFMVLRELAGLHDWPAVIRLYAIPQSVLGRMGAQQAAPASDAP
ncbi:MAG: hypothetical protein Q4G14_09535 [Paracoccus sp. (in: a-proteobacteria)]|uniref:DUF6665 family protein n=1 Tax=Paracoccus sp. TaxID=267 RepID=UPI0026DF9AD4|nr:DUF6665 family protein [Paracoccus sp. (in: a-proteobacteria)]MDO5613466.1 hypothetical protein [Paracoccus sp. (in: a-proteobacteria)]